MARFERILGGLIFLFPLLLAAQVQQPKNGGTGTGTAPTSGQLLIGQSGGKYAPKTASGSCTVDSTGAFSCGGGGGAFNGINAQTTSYMAVSGDNGKLIVFNCPSACSLTLPSTPPSSTWAIGVQNVGSAALGVTVPSGLTLDGVLGAAQLNSQMGTLLWTDGTNYFTERGAVITRSNVIPFRVQSKQNSCGVGPCGTTLTTAVSPGSALIFECMHGSSGNCNVTPTDVQGDTFTLTNIQDLVGEFEIDLFVACNAVGGSTTITSASGGTIQAAYEVSNVAASSCVDAYNSGQNTTNNATQGTGSATTTQPYDFIFVTGAARTGGGGTTMTEGNSYTPLVSSGLIASALTYNSWYGLKPGAGSVSDTVGYSPTAGGEYAGILALKPLASSAAIIQGDLIVAGPNGQLQALHAGAATYVLTSNGLGAAPTYQAIPPAPPSGPGAWTNITGSTQVTATGCTQSDTTGGSCAVSGGSTSVVEFSVIPGTYRRLQLVVWGEGSAGSPLHVRTTFNSDTGSDYANNGNYQIGSSAVAANNSTSVTYCSFGNLPNTGVGQITFDVPFYANTSFYKISVEHDGMFLSPSSGTNDDSENTCGWASTSAITSVTFTTSTGDYVAGTQFMILAQQ
jgi:hypothetical protein